MIICGAVDAARDKLVLLSIRPIALLIPAFALRKILRTSQNLFKRTGGDLYAFSTPEGEDGNVARLLV